MAEFNIWCGACEQGHYGLYDWAASEERRNSSYGIWPTVHLPEWFGKAMILFIILLRPAVEHVGPLRSERYQRRFQNLYSPQKFYTLSQSPNLFSPALTRSA